MRLKNVIIVFVVSIIIASFAHAALYEVEGKMMWDGKPLQKADVYLLRDHFEVLKTRIEGDKDIAEVQDQQFSKQYAELQDEINQMVELSGPQLKKRAGKVLKKRFLKLIDQHVIREIPHRDGRFYVNISPDVKYYIVIVKKRGLWGWNKPFLYWMKEIYFQPGVLQTPKKIVFDEEEVKKL